MDSALLLEVSVTSVSRLVGVKLSVVGQSELAGPSVYLTVMSSSNTPESGAVSRIGPSSGVPSLAEFCETTDEPVWITPFCTVSPPAVASTTASEPLAT